MDKELATKPCQANLKTLYKNRAFANFLHWFAVRSLRAYSKFCFCLISYAIELNPSREIFRKNLNDLGLTDIWIYAKKRTFRFYTIPEGCRQLSENVVFFNTNKAITLYKPKTINPNFTVTDDYACNAYLPNTYLAEIKDAQVFAGTDLIIAKRLILYDGIDKEKVNQYAVRSPLISAVSAEKITVNIPKKIKYVETGIHLTADHSANYFHWLVECLPRLSLVSNLSADIPLLVDDFLPIQFYDILDMLNSERREIIRMKRKNSYIINKLYYPSRSSIVHDNYNVPIYNKDVIYSADGINFIRNSILAAINSKVEPTRKIFISRKNSDYRQLLNSVEVENFLVPRGFEIIFPENLSFFSQVKIFTQAKIIIGQSGAGMTNFIFAPKTVKILMMLSDAPGSNLQLFNALAKVVDINLEYLIGKTASVLKKYNLHSDFHVDINLLKAYLDKESL